MPGGDGAGTRAAVTVRARAYPWDVLGDPHFPGRVHALELDGVVLAAAYHSVRAATPWHPRHLTVTARHAALYRRVDAGAWAGRRLVPAAADWMAEPDPFGSAAEALTAAGIPVTAWVVLTHATRLGEAFPDVAVANCVGERYPYALCPAREEVRAYAATLAAEAVRGTPVTGVCLEGCGQFGVGHGGHHDKTAGAWGPMAARLLSVCCCPACRREWAARGLEPARAVAALAAHTRRLVRAEPVPPRREGAPAAAGPDEALGGMLETLLAVRAAATDALRRQVVAAVRSVRRDLRITLHAHPDPWETGASPGLTSGAVRAAGAGRDADAGGAGGVTGGAAGGPAGGTDAVAGVVVPCWTTGPGAPETIRRTRGLLPPRAAVGGYVTVLPPVRAEEIVPHVRRLRAAGMGELDLYHLGLAGPVRRTSLAEAVRAVRGR